MNRRRWLLVAAIAVIVVLAIVGGVARPVASPGASPGASAVAGATAGASPGAAAGASPAATAGLSSGTTPAPMTSAATPNPAPTGSTSGSLSLTQLLDVLPVRAESRTGYKRALFVHWIDADGDGCNTRREVLIVEAIVAPTVTAGCHLVGGRWYSPYDGITTTNAATFDIDHVVPLAEARDSGAYAWSPDRRTAFANDLGVPWSLLAVSAASNRSKSDGDPADWMPPRTEFRCTYVAMWLAVKVRWELSIDRRERGYLAPLAASCPDRMPVDLAR